MIELIILGFATLGIYETAQKRRKSAVTYAVVAACGYFAMVFIGAFLGMGRGALVLGILWLGCCYLMAQHVDKSGDLPTSSWVCPECQFMNIAFDPLCACGYRYSAVREKETLESLDAAGKGSEAPAAD
ncbi:MAG: hypothetical protein KDD47_20155 [Acidobacteria bacterium]|nr:hypothetical protein [Acidobacteriota bacterium]